MAPSVRQPRPVAPKPPVLDFEILPATPAAGPVTLEDWFAAPVWFVGAGNRGSGKHAATWQHNGQTFTCRHSKQLQDGGLKLARFGGRLPKGQQVQPWASFETIEALIAETPELQETERRPCVSVAGDDDTRRRPCRLVASTPISNRAWTSTASAQPSRPTSGKH